MATAVKGPSALAFVAALTLAFSGCGGGGSSVAEPERVPPDPPARPPPTSRAQIVFASSPASLLRESAANWRLMTPAKRLAVARFYLDTYGGRYTPRITARELVATATEDIRAGIIPLDPLLVRSLLGAYEQAADSALSASIGEQRAKLLPSGRIVGKRAAEVRELIGRPDRTEEIGGRDVWYYTFQGRQYQLVIEGGRVARVDE